MVNHTQRHADAVAAYASSGKYGGVWQDIWTTQYFSSARVSNSAPNWLIYPHGPQAMRWTELWGGYTGFSRVPPTPTPESYPYGSPLRVKQLELHSHGDGEIHRAGSDHDAS